MKLKKVLIIEDNDCKSEDIKNILEKLGVEEITISKTLNSGLVNLRDNHYDLLVLDNCFPLRNDSFPEKDMGLSLLYRLSRTHSYEEIIKELLIVMCSSDKLEIPEYDNLNVLGSIEYNSSVYMYPYFEELLTKED